MSKYILAAAVAFAFAGAPVAVFAQSTGSTGSSAKMKGPPNANGMEQGDQNSNQQGETGRSSSDDSGSNGAASAKATGADKQ